MRALPTEAVQPALLTFGRPVESLMMAVVAAMESLFTFSSKEPLSFLWREKRIAAVKAVVHWSGCREEIFGRLHSPKVLDSPVPAHTDEGITDGQSDAGSGDEFHGRRGQSHVDDLHAGRENTLVCTGIWGKTCWYLNNPPSSCYLTLSVCTRPSRWKPSPFLTYLGLWWFGASPGSKRFLILGLGGGDLNDGPVYFFGLKDEAGATVLTVFKAFHR